MSFRVNQGIDSSALANTREYKGYTAGPKVQTKPKKHTNPYSGFNAPPIFTPGQALIGTTHYTLQNLERLRDGVAAFGLFLSPIPGMIFPRILSDSKRALEGFGILDPPIHY